MDKIEKAPQVIAEKITHRLIDGEKEESFAVRLPAQGTKKIMAIKISPKGTTVSQTGQWTKKIPHSTEKRKPFSLPLFCL